MVAFKSWRDGYLFIKKYATFSCLNCQYSSSNLDMSAEHTDAEYVHLFCSKSLDMVRLDYMFVCSKWENDGECIDADEDLWKLDERVVDELERMDQKVSIDDVDRLVKKYESV